MSAHARLSPSASSRWMLCPGSVLLIERLIEEGLIVEDRSSEAAAEGTAAHELRAECLDLGLEPHDFIGQTIRADGMAFEVTEEMCDHLQTGIDWVREQAGDPIIEARVSLDRWLPGQFGTLDCGFDHDGLLTINDLKYGLGKVSADENRQLRIYALGFYDLMKRPVETVRLVIDQPRAGGLKIWSCPLSELLEFGEEVRAAGKLALSPDAPLVAGETQCQWCPVKDTSRGCAAYDKFCEDIFCGAFDDLDADPEFVEPETMEPERRWYIITHTKMAKSWLDQLYEASLTAAQAGKPDPGSKLVTGNEGDRFYTDPQAAEEILVAAVGDDDAFGPRKLKSPKQAEDMLKPKRKRRGNPEAWESLCEIINRPPGKAKVVPISEDGEPATPFADMFDELL